MKFNPITWVIIISLTFVSCDKNQEEQLQKDTQLMANLECEARHLKEERFKVANDFRFMEDSLAKHKIPLSDWQSRQMDSVKNVYTLRTGKLADKITKTMDSLFAASYKTAEQRQSFDVATEKVLQEICK
jgi:hypothetical protein